MLSVCLCVCVFAFWTGCFLKLFLLPRPGQVGPEPPGYADVDEQSGKLFAGADAGFGLWASLGREQQGLQLALI